MAIFYNDGEIKKRPGVYQNHKNAGSETNASAQDGIVAIPIKACWGPVGKVVKITNADELYRTYGAGDYSATNTVPAAAAVFKGGASAVYTYRMGTGGKAASFTADGLTITAKYPGTLELSVAVQAMLSDSTKKQLQVYAGTALVETFVFAADTKAEGANLIAAASGSKYVTITGTAATVPVTAAASGKLTGGENPTVTNADYSTAFAAFETYYYNTITLDVDDDENMTLSLLLQAYLDNAYKFGKLGIAVFGEKTTVDFSTRCQHAKAFNDAKCVYLGGGYKAGTEDKDGVLAICYTAGLIAATPSNRGITHTVIEGATELCESLTYAQYEEAIDSGMLMLSLSPDGLVWYDSAINTLTIPDENQDEGWKKIRRVKVRFEMIDRLDRALMPKVGKVSADSDGVADIVQTGQRVLDMMANSEGKLMAGPTFQEDPNNPFVGDSAWCIINANDIDSLEKIYLQYQFRYSQQS